MKIVHSWLNDLVPVGDDIDVFAPADDAAREGKTPLGRFCTLRQQAEKETDEPFLALSDFVAPAGAAGRSSGDARSAAEPLKGTDDGWAGLRCGRSPHY